MRGGASVGTRPTSVAAAMDASRHTVAAAPGTELDFAGPGRLAELVRAGEVRPRELVEHALERIAAADGELGAFRVLLAEEALAQADALEGAGAVLLQEEGPGAIRAAALAP